MSDSLLYLLLIRARCRFYQALDWFTAARKQYRRERYFRSLRRREVAFGAGFQSPLEREDDRQRRLISQEQTRWIP